MPVQAQQMKKMLVLKFVNTDKNANFTYLEASLTDAVRGKLKQLFAFAESPEDEVKQVADENFLYEEDYNTKSVAMNLGLLSGQDVVIAGGFRVEGQRKLTIITDVSILDISNKKVIAEFQEKGPADNRIFTTLDRIAERISVEAKAVLPTKEQWQRGGGPSAPSGPVFNNFIISAGAGAGMFMLDYADRIEPGIPVLRFGVQANVPAIWDVLTLSVQTMYMTEKPIADKNPEIEGLTITTTSYMPGLYLGAAISAGSFTFHPRFGGGYVMQSIVVTGVRNENLSNSMPFAAGGLDVSYRLSKAIDLTLSFDSIAQLESGRTTLANLGTMGVSFHL